MKVTLPGDRPLIMGVLNVTPDSFSDGGRFLDGSVAIDHAMQMVSEGADIIDVGGESTRPGSGGVSDEEEMERVVPVMAAIRKRSDVTISVDTTKPGVAREAVKAGAGIINDVSMLRYGDGLAGVAAHTRTILVLMHSRKSPKDMQSEIRYGDVVDDVCAELAEAVTMALASGVAADRIWLDPGIGFAKTPPQNLEVIGRLGQMVKMGYPVLVGPSRKSFIEAFTGAPVDDRMGGTAAAVTAAVMNGARAVRVHDVKMMRQAALIAAGIVAESTKGRGDA